MNYGETKAYLTQLINRKDVSDALASQFLEQSQTRIERRIRCTGMEQFVEFTLDTDRFIVPTDLLETIDLYSGSKELQRVDMAQYLKVMEGIGEPSVFLQTGHSILLRPQPGSGVPMFLRYYSAMPKLQVNSDDNLWSITAVDALVYGAASLAGDFYEDERLQRFEQKFETAISELQDQALREDFAGPMQIAPAYNYDED
jgi:hypothetical protein